MSMLYGYGLGLFQWGVSKFSGLFIKDAATKGDLSRITEVHESCKKALEEPYGKISLEEPLRICEEIKTSCQQMPKELLFEVECVQNMVDFLKCPISLDPQFIPQKTREMALKILAGVSNPFKNRVMCKQLGRGAFGSVNLIQVSGELYAEKKMQRQKDVQAKHAHEYRQLLAFKDHPNIVHVNYADGQSLYLDYIEGDTLENKLESLSPKDIRRIFLELAGALAYIHHLGNLHMDIKGDNILLTKEGNRVKITDFGLAKPVEEFIEGDDSLLQTDHLPPEYLQGKLLRKDCQKIDVWSFGFLIWECLKKDNVHTPFSTQGHGLGHSEVKERVRNFKGFMPGELVSQLNRAKQKMIDPCGELVEVMEKCLSQNPEDRPTMLEIEKNLSQAKYSRKTMREENFNIDSSAVKRKNFS